jgi:hypothetical protein
VSARLHDKQKLKELFLQSEQNLNELFAAEGSCAITQKVVKNLNHWIHDRALDAELALLCCDLRPLIATCHCSAAFIGRSQSLAHQGWKQELSWTCRDASVLSY